MKNVLFAAILLVSATSFAQDAAHKDAAHTDTAATDSAKMEKTSKTVTDNADGTTTTSKHKESKKRPQAL